MISKKRMEEILKTEQTPLYIFDMEELTHRIEFLRENLPERVELCYAVKANPFILESISRMVDWLEICSPGELRICQRLKLPERKFVISGVYKEAGLMEELISGKKEVGYYTVESVLQFIHLRATAERLKRRIPVLLRLTSGNQFGLDEYTLAELIDKYKKDYWIDIIGIQYFSGTQKNSIKKLAREIFRLDDYLAGLYEMFEFKARKLEFGPGFPVSYFEGEAFEEKMFLKQFSVLLSNMRFDGQITLEIGRSLAASCGTYLTRIVDTKRNHSENYAIVDGGMHQMVYYGQSMAMKQPRFYLLPSRTEGNENVWNICGSLCTINDFLVKRTHLPDLQIGDVLAFENAGAYCMTEGISLFLSRDLPEIVLVKEDGSYLSVRNQIATDILNTPNYFKKMKRGTKLWKKD